MSSTNKNKRKFFNPLNIVVFTLTLAANLALTITFANSTISHLKTENGPDTSPQEAAHRKEVLEQKYPTDLCSVSELPYSTKKADLFVNAESAIIIDSKTGSILFEKNADDPIPPASMTKLVEMYVVYNAIENGEVSLDDIVPLPPESWSQNLPYDASRMFLGPDQTVTLNELLLGLAIPSANDASIAVANYVCGSMDAFVAKMNDLIKSMGLTKTHFVESSGYSELNVTTAREFAAFCRVYVTKFPWALEKYHAQDEISYPLEQNLPSYQKYFGDSLAITQKNTNKLLGKLPGCDGLKTGYIDESGYNLALTAERYGTRFISVTMRGPGQGSAQGNRYRVQDGNTLMEYAFKGFADYKAPTGPKAHRYILPLFGSEQEAIWLVPAKDETFTVPYIAGDSAGASAGSVTVSVEMPEYLNGAVECGQELGKITYKIGKTELYSLPLVADRDSEAASGLKKLYANLQSLFLDAVIDVKTAG